jgi:hypothetical protein
MENLNLKDEFLKYYFFQIKDLINKKKTKIQGTLKKIGHLTFEAIIFNKVYLRHYFPYYYVLDRQHFFLLPHNYIVMNDEFPHL